MELLYVWIKNHNDVIINQEFNFSSGEYKFNLLSEEKNIINLEVDELERLFNKQKKINLKLEILKKNSKLNEDFFGKNISGITAIIGGNGTGKSQILKNLLNINYLTFDGLYLLKENEKFKLYYNDRDMSDKRINIEFSGETIIIKKAKEKDTHKLLQKKFKFIKIPIIEKYETFIETPFEIVGNKIFKKELLKEALFKNDFMVLKGIKILRELNILGDKNIWYELDPRSYIENRHKNFKPKYLFLETEWRKKIASIKSKEDKEIYKSIFFELEEKLEIIMKKENEYRRFKHKKNIYLEEIKTIDELGQLEIEDKEPIKALIKSLELMDDLILEFKKSKSNLEIALQFIQNFYFSEENDLITGLPLIFFSVKIGLSSGEKLLSHFFEYLLESLGKWTNELETENQEYILLLDEPDLGLHPEWQRKFIFYLVKFFEKYFEDKKEKYHIILTTHSPLILSDIPKENVIFLSKFLDEENNKKGITKVLNNDNEITKTYAANIYSLYRKSFFLEKTIGEFSYNKLKEIKEELVNVIEKKENIKRKYTKEIIKGIIDMIGEPLIKERFEILYKKAFFDNIDNEIKYYEDKLKKLNKIKEDRNDKD